MRLEQYTADAICRSMGLAGFDPPDDGAIRVIFTPAFHPEVCVTLSGGRMSVVALTEHLWRQDFPRRLPAVTGDTPAFPDLLAQVAAALAQWPTDRPVCIDGMGVQCSRRVGESIERVSGHVFQPVVETLARHLLWSAWVGCRGATLVNALAECARYVGADYRLQPDPARPPARRVLVIGMPDERADFFALLRARGCAG